MNRVRTHRCAAGPHTAACLCHRPAMADRSMPRTIAHHACARTRAWARTRVFSDHQLCRVRARKSPASAGAATNSVERATGPEQTRRRNWRNGSGGRRGCCRSLNVAAPSCAVTLPSLLWWAGCPMKPI